MKNPCELLLKDAIFRRSSSRLSTMTFGGTQASLVCVWSTGIMTFLGWYSTPLRDVL